MRTVAIILAAGSGSRHGGSPKQFRIVNGKPLYYYSVATHEQVASIDTVRLVVPTQNIEEVRDFVRRSGFRKMNPDQHVIPGGRTRQASVFCALKTLFNSQESTMPDLVVISAAARVVVTAKTIEQACQAGQSYPAVAAARHATNVIACNDGFRKTAPLYKQADLWEIGSPLVFHLKPLYQAYTRAIEASWKFANETELYYKVLGLETHILPCHYRELFKVTYPQDIALAECLLKQQQAY